MTDEREKLRELFRCVEGDIDSLADAVLHSDWLAAHTKAAVDAAVLVEREAAAVRVEALLELRGLDLSHQLAIEGAARVVRDGGDS